MASAVYAQEVDASYTVFAPGVYHNGAEYVGWVDYNKSDADAKYGTVMGMCWAASASNVISWWYQQNGLTSTAPADPWLVYQAICYDDGNVPSTAFNHWINGITPTWVDEKFDDSTGNWVPGYYQWPGYIDLTHENKETSSWYNGGFLKNDYTETTQIANKYSHSSGYAFAEALIKALENGYAISLSTYTYVGSTDGKPTGAHAYTLWGADYGIDKDGHYVITTAYMTDSDDSISKLVPKAMKTVDEGFTLDNGFIVEYADGMRTARTVVSVPEPAGATLSLLALAGLAARRRR